MSGTGRINEALPGHHGATTSNTTSQNGSGLSHHDPELEAKKATSAAGNYPYWDNTSQGQQGKRSEGPSSGSLEPQHSRAETSGGLGSGGLATGSGATGATGAGHIASDSRDHEPLYASTRAGQTKSSNHPAGVPSSAAKQFPETGDLHTNRREEALTTGAGVAGAGYLASKRNEHQGLDGQQRGTATSSHKKTPSATPDNLKHITGEDRSGGRGQEALAGGAGLAGASHSASHKKGDRLDASSNTSSSKPRVAFGDNNASPATTKTGAGGLSSLGSHHHDPEIGTKQATSAAGNYPHWGGDNSNKRRDEEILGAGAGAAGLAGAAHHHSHHPSHETTPGTASSGHLGQRDATGRDAELYGAAPGQGSSTSGHLDSRRREEEVLAGASGLGGAGYTGSEAMRRHNDQALEDSAYPDFTGQGELTPAQRAALAAWNETNSGIGAYTETGSHNLGSGSGLEYGATGTTAGSASRVGGLGSSGNGREGVPRTHAASDEAARLTSSGQSGVGSSSGVGASDVSLAGSKGGLGNSQY